MLHRIRNTVSFFHSLLDRSFFRLSLDAIHFYRDEDQHFSDFDIVLSFFVDFSAPYFNSRACFILTVLKILIGTAVGPMKPPLFQIWINLYLKTNLVFEIQLFRWLIKNIIWNEFELLSFLMIKFLKTENHTFLLKFVHSLYPCFVDPSSFSELPLTVKVSPL